jgi:hypothetical protein
VRALALILAAALVAGCSSLPRPPLAAAPGTVAPGYGIYPRVGMYSAMRGNGAPFLRPDGSLDSAVCREQARWDVAVLDAAAPKQRPEIVRALRAYNPRITLLGYVMGAVYWTNPHPALGDTSSDYPWHYWAAVRNTDGVLWNTRGEPWIFCNVNVARGETMNALAGVILEDVVRPGLWDGLLVDVTCPRMYGIGAEDQIIDLARLGFSSVRDFSDAWGHGHRAFAGHLRLLSPSGYFLVGNCGQDGEADLWSGWMRENFPYQNAGPGDDPWEANMLGNVWGQRGYLADTVYVAPHMSWLISEPGYDSTSAETLRRLRFGLGSATLGSGVHSFARNEWDRRRFWWFPEYAVNQYGNASTNPYWKGWLGASLGRCRRLPSGMWRRDFKRGLDLVNPTTSAVRIVPGGYWRRIKAALPGYTGARDTAFTVPARDALFLLRDS